MFAVGVDVSNGRSTVVVLQTKTSALMKPFEIPHTAEGFASLAGKLAGLYEARGTRNFINGTYPQ